MRQLACCQGCGHKIGCDISSEAHLSRRQKAKAQETDNHHLICCMSRSIFLALHLYLYNSPLQSCFVSDLPFFVSNNHSHHSLHLIAYDLDCPFPALIKLELHSSYALPAPKPKPTKAGHARRLKMRTEKTTPKDRPRDERMRRDERQRSHYHVRSAQTLLTSH